MHQGPFSSKDGLLIPHVAPKFQRSNINQQIRFVKIWKPFLLWKIIKLLRGPIGVVVMRLLQQCPWSFSYREVKGKAHTNTWLRLMSAKGMNSAVMAYAPQQWINGYFVTVCTSQLSHEYVLVVVKSYVMESIFIDKFSQASAQIRVKFPWDRLFFMPLVQVQWTAKPCSLTAILLRSERWWPKHPALWLSSFRGKFTISRKMSGLLIPQAS